MCVPIAEALDGIRTAREAPMILSKSIQDTKTVRVFNQQKHFALCLLLYLTTIRHLCQSAFFDKLSTSNLCSLPNRLSNPFFYPVFSHFSTHFFLILPSFAKKIRPSNRRNRQSRTGFYIFIYMGINKRLQPPARA